MNDLGVNITFRKHVSISMVTLLAVFCLNTKLVLVFLNFFTQKKLLVVIVCLLYYVGIGHNTDFCWKKIIKLHHHLSVSLKVLTQVIQVLAWVQVFYNLDWHILIEILFVCYSAVGLSTAVLLPTVCHMGRKTKF